MARRKNANAEAEWRGRLERFADHDGTVMSFCKSEGVTDKAFYYWRKRLERDADERSQEIAFVEVGRGSDAVPIELVVGEYIVRMRGVVEAAALERVLEVLSERR